LSQKLGSLDNVASNNNLVKVERRDPILSLADGAVRAGGIGFQETKETFDVYERDFQ